MEERLTAAVYVNVLNEVMIPSVNAVYGQNFTFQQDNAPIHTAGIVQNFFQENNIAVYPGLQRVPT